MSNKLLNWVHEIESKIKSQGIETQELKVVDETMSDNPCVTVNHYNPQKCLGTITLWETGAVYVEVISYSDGDILLVRNEVVTVDADLDDILSKYIDVLCMNQA
jgi:hypothetical protein